MKNSNEQEKNDSHPGTASEKKPTYSPPAIEEETIFESLAMACTATGKCKTPQSA